MKRFLLIWTAVALMGCSKKLTQSNAVGEVQRHLEQTHSAIAKANFGGMKFLLEQKTQLSLPQTPAVFQRLAKDGYITQQVSQISYPDISGSWRGVAEWEMRGFDVVFNLQMTQSRPPTAMGTYCVAGPPGEHCWPTSGTPDRNGEYSFAPLSVLANGLATIHRADQGALAGTMGTGPDQRVPRPYSFPLLLRGQGSGRNIIQEEYAYAWTNKLPPDVYDGGTGELTIGTIVVENCEQLLMNGTSSANAILRWHVSLSGFGRLLFPDAKDTQNLTMEALFGKQPDETWVVTGVRFANLTL